MRQLQEGTRESQGVSKGKVGGTVLGFLPEVVTCIEWISGCSECCACIDAGDRVQGYRAAEK